MIPGSPRSDPPFQAGYDRFAAQFGIFRHFAGGKKGVTVDVEDGAGKGTEGEGSVGVETLPYNVSNRQTQWIKGMEKVTGDAGAAFGKLRKVLAQRSDTTLISSDSNMIMVEFRTMLGFVDDGLFVLDAANGLIQVRSAARLG